MGVFNKKDLREPTVDDVFAVFQRQQGDATKDGRGHRNVTPFEAPVSGEALTEEPGKYPYEQPPKYTDPRKAVYSVFQRLSQPQNAARTLALLEQGLPIKTMATTLLMTGFMEGAWSAPMMPLMAGPVALILRQMAQEAGIEFTMDPPKPQAKIPDYMMALALSAEEETAEEAPMPRAKGLMGAEE